MRDGSRKTLDIKVGALPSDGEEMSLSGTEGAASKSNRLGMTVANLTTEQKKAIDLQGGVVIQDVQDGPAAMIGLRAGDVITHLNNQAIDSAKTFTKIAEALPNNRSLSMRVLRQGRASFITFKLAD
jgi:serine protease Do